MSKRPIRKARRKARRAKGQTAIDGLRKMVHEYLLGLDKRLSTLEALPLTEQGERIQRIEAFLGKDFIKFLEPMFRAK